MNKEEYSILDIKQWLWEQYQCENQEFNNQLLSVLDDMELKFTEREVVLSKRLISKSQLEEKIDALRMSDFEKEGIEISEVNRLKLKIFFKKLLEG